MSEDTSVHHIRKTRTGTVISSKMDKTIVVSVERRKAHKLYGKIVKVSKKYYAHDEKGEALEGDVVRIQETRPISKLKSWRLVDVIRRSADNTVESVEVEPVSIEALATDATAADATGADPTAVDPIAGPNA